MSQHPTLRLLPVSFIFLLVLGSCQQRYGHVKKIETGNTLSVEKETPQSNHKPETKVLVATDSLPKLSALPEITPEETKAKAATSKTKPYTKGDKLDASITLFPSGIMKQLIPGPSEEVPSDKPLTGGEKVMIVCLFYLLIFAFVGVAILPMLLLPASSLVLISVLTGCLLVLAAVFSFRIGKKSLNKSLNRTFSWQDLLGYFILAESLFILTNLAFTVFASIGMVSLFLGILPLLLMFVAGIYILIWEVVRKWRSKKAQEING
jgi:hypothetical protein